MELSNLIMTSLKQVQRRLARAASTFCCIFIFGKNNLEPPVVIIEDEIYSSHNNCGDYDCNYHDLLDSLPPGDLDGLPLMDIGDDDVFRDTEPVGR